MLYIEATVSEKQTCVIGVPGYDHKCPMLFWLHSPVTDWLLEHDGDTAVSLPALLDLVKRLKPRGGCKVDFFNPSEDLDFLSSLTHRDCVVYTTGCTPGWMVYETDVQLNGAHVPKLEPLYTEKDGRGQYFSFLKRLYSSALRKCAGRPSKKECREDAQ